MSWQYLILTLVDQFACSCPTVDMSLTGHSSWQSSVCDNTAVAGMCKQTKRSSLSLQVQQEGVARAYARVWGWACLCVCVTMCVCDGAHAYVCVTVCVCEGGHVCVHACALEGKGCHTGHFFNMATIQVETTMKKIMRRAHLSTVMSMCRCSDM